MPSIVVRFVVTHSHAIIPRWQYTPLYVAWLKQFGMHPIVTVHSAPVYSIKPQRPMKCNQVNSVEHVSPGPAAYAPAITVGKSKNNPAFSLASRGEKNEKKKKSIPINLEKDDDDKPTPGPGQYTPKLAFVRGNIPRFSFRCKHSDYELFVPDFVNGEFSF